MDILRYLERANRKIEKNRYWIGVEKIEKHIKYDNLNIKIEKDREKYILNMIIFKKLGGTTSPFYVIQLPPSLV